jgi:hypothetical protein
MIFWGRGQSRSRGQALAGKRGYRRSAPRSLLVASALLAGCGPHHVDIIVRAEAGDPCAALSASECAADTQDGCSLQPNPAGCHSSDPGCGAGSCTSGDPFVRRSGEALFLHGEPFSFVGTVSWGLAWNDNGCEISGYASQAEALGPSFDELATMQVSVLRVWAFQSYAGASGSDYSHFDRLVDAARTAGVRLLPVLENMHADCTSGGARDDAWFTSGYKNPYGNYALSYRDYVAGLVAHFRDEPTILGWELMHEASAQQFSALDAFIDDMTSLVRRTDPNHLLAVGLNDGDAPATSTDGAPSNYFKLQNRSTIDLVDVQDFNAPDEPLPTQNALCRSIAHTLGKVAFVGAAGVKTTDSSAAALKIRATQIENKLNAARAAGFRGFLAYDYAPRWTNPLYEFDARPEEPLAGAEGVLARHAASY